MNEYMKKGTVNKSALEQDERLLHLRKNKIDEGIIKSKRHII